MNFEERKREKKTECTISFPSFVFQAKSAVIRAQMVMMNKFASSHWYIFIVHPYFLQYSK